MKRITRDRQLTAEEGAQYQVAAKSEEQGRVLNYMPIAANVRSKNPLRTDPTRTTTLRRQFVAALHRRFAQLQGSILDFMVIKDALDLGEHPIRVFNASSREFRFNTDPQKLEAFNDWFALQVERDIFSVPSGTPAGEPWLAEYVTSAYRRGVANAYLASRQADLLEEPGIGQQNLSEFLLSAFSGPVSVDKVRLLYTRTFTDLKGVTAEMGTRLSRILAQGLVDGLGPLKIAQQMNAEIRSLSEKRAFVIARTEIIRAHAEGQLDAFRRLGVQELGVRAEWQTARDDRVCPLCHENEGKTFTIEEASGLIPLHPNCRCSWIPFV